MKKLSIEDKELLLKDLCARLPYGVKVHIKGEYHKHHKVEEIDINYEYVRYFENLHLCEEKITNCRLYLRPMSSMTEEERLELSRLSDDKFKFYLYTTKPEIICYEKYNYLEGLKVLDWLNAHHFDYRGLIEKGLALEAPDGLYKL